MIEQRVEPRQWPADGSAKPNPIDVTDSLRDGASLVTAKIGEDRAALLRHPGLEPGSTFFLAAAAEKAGRPRIKSGVTVKP